jgi:hypothetical protein
MKYACAISVVKPDDNGYLMACMVEATSTDEANGKAMRIARRRYPVKAGFTDHFVWSCPETFVVDPDTMTINPVPE